MAVNPRPIIEGGRRTNYTAHPLVRPGGLNTPTEIAPGFSHKVRSAGGLFFSSCTSPNCLRLWGRQCSGGACRSCGGVKKKVWNTADRTGVPSELSDFFPPSPHVSLSLSLQLHLCDIDPISSRYTSRNRRCGISQHLRKSLTLEQSGKQIKSQPVIHFLFYLI